MTTKEKLITLVLQFLFIFGCCLVGLLIGSGLTYIIENKYWWYFGATAGVSVGIIGVAYLIDLIERKFGDHE